MSVDAFATTGNAADIGAIRLPDAVAGVALWWCDLERAETHADALAAALSEAEHARAARFGTPALRRRWTAGRGTLRSLLGVTLGQPAAAVALRRGPRGRPELAAAGARIDFNVSHTLHVALVAIARDLPAATRIGVDIEHVERAVGAERLARKFLTAREQATLAGLDADAYRRGFLRLWTCKEAMSKATGDGLAAPFGRLDVALAGAPVLLDGPPPYDPPAWSLHDVPAPAGYFATLALWRRGE